VYLHSSLLRNESSRNNMLQTDAANCHRFCLRQIGASSPCR
jgi:hypothetical protein